jgi:hypothetical protein
LISKKRRKAIVVEKTKANDLRRELTQKEDEMIADIDIFKEEEQSKPVYTQTIAEPFKVTDFLKRHFINLVKRCNKNANTHFIN